MVFKNRDKLLEFLNKNYVMELGSGSQGVCYLNKRNKRVYKIFHQFFDFCLDDFLVNYSYDEIMRFKDIDNNSFVFPDDVIYVNDEIVGYITDYVDSKSLYEFNPLFLNLDNFSKDVGVVSEDIRRISELGVMTFDVMYNVLYGKKGIKVIDTLDYSYSSLDSEKLFRMNNQNFNDEIFCFLIDGFFDSFIASDSLLSEMYSDKNVDTLVFISLFKKKISEYIGREVVRLFDARCIVNDNVDKPKRYIRKLF